MRTAAIALGVGLAVGAPAAADGWIPPMKVDVGYQSVRTDAEVTTGKVAMIGLSWATVYPYSTRFEFGLGYVRADAVDPRAAARALPPAMAADLVHLHGAYAELGLRIAAGRGWRAWASTRVEGGAGAGTGFLGGAARLTTELWAGLPDACHGGPGGIFGVAAIGVWIEAGARQHGELGSTFVAAGLNLKVPFIGVPGHGGCCR